MFVHLKIGTPWSDGTEGVTQCPILPGETFRYQFVVDRVRYIGLARFVLCLSKTPCINLSLTFVKFEICSQELIYTMPIMVCKEKMVSMDPLWFGFQKDKQSLFPMIVIVISSSQIGIIKAATNTPLDWLPLALDSPGWENLIHC